MPNIKINGQEYTVEDGLTLIQVCDSLGIQIPRFCYHEKLPSVGSCRMCLVELKGSPKLVPACTTSITEGMEVLTENNSIDSARKTMLELLLVNHPLDCPICDQGGECDLQDITYRYGVDRSHYNVEKRAVEDKEFGPLIKSNMTRCILCTRCIRFAREIAGVEELGGIGRGDHTEIATYVDKAINFELSGNLVDVCPVGALTNNDYAFKARPWELIHTNSIDVMDALGSNIRVDSSPLSVVRIQPRPNEEVNEDWISDKARYIVDALRMQRLDSPMIRVDGKLKKTTWDNALAEVAKNIKKHNGNEIASIVGDFVDLETIFALKEFLGNFEVTNLESRQQGVLFDHKDPCSYLFNTTVQGIEEADACLIIGSNPRLEAPVLNARIRKRYLQGGFNIALVGEKADLKYKYDHIGDNLSVLEDILSGKHEFANKLKNAKTPMLILGLSALIENTQEVIALCKAVAEKYGMIREDWNGYNVLQTSTSTINGLSLGFVPEDYKKGINDILHQVSIDKIKVLWLLNSDEIDFSKINKNTFVIYQGHHGDKGAKFANVILPTSLWLEKSGSYINLEGRIQFAFKAVPCVGEAREDWKVFRKLSELLQINVGYDSFEQLQQKMFERHPELASGFLKPAYINTGKTKFDIHKNKISYLIKDYYLSDMISRNSKKMLQCSALFTEKV
jgi:NADH-quinone oxidoreductase subunit G